VWAHETPNERRTLYMQTSYDGADILWDENSYWTDFDDGAASVVHRMKLDAVVTETVPTPGLHHTFLELSGGAIVWGGRVDGRETVQEVAADGTVREIFDCTALWLAQGATEACDGNSLFWNEAEDTLYFSSDAGNTVVDLDRSTGEVLHLFGQLDGAWGFEDPSTTFWKQHSPTRTPEGHLLVSTWTSPGNHELVAREYEIDETNQVLRQTWTCGQGSGISADYSGEAHRLSNGNTLLNYGEGAALGEYTPDCTLAWRVVWPDGNFVSAVTLLEDLYALAP
jgi:hypothetical protein